ncbi:hypothetical protein ABEB36_014610 [Hypothenemus hampei]|uniref:Uncharacterized protein n=1 Tax=Hypothenemus hampei TaxID=57062 RepID=A0ABD1E2B4_HYPHA
MERTEGLAADITFKEDTLLYSEIIIEEDSKEESPKKDGGAAFRGKQISDDSSYEEPFSDDSYDDPAYLPSGSSSGTEDSEANGRNASRHKNHVMEINNNVPTQTAQSSSAKVLKKSNKTFIKDDNLPGCSREPYRKRVK